MKDQHIINNSFDSLYDLYIDGTHETDRGWFAVVMHPGIDGNFADVYGESEEDALKNANDLLTMVKFGLNSREVVGCTCHVLGAQDIPRKLPRQILLNV